ncbi:acyltransferase [Listeria booriae]|uniref:acyltransferase n=1 Tax=Listeria booriae TaxID=1552123 RepID=UPI0016268F04|nr:acyltransferase [Listeria booriae]MBC1575643.1 acyltransferase [Listeria booriae]
MISWKKWKRIIGVRRVRCYIAIKNLFGTSISIGRGLYFRRNFSIVTLAEGHISIGSNVFFNNNCSVNCCDAITIGSNVIFGENVHLYDHDHRYALGTDLFAEQGYSTAPITIGNNCWIATNVTILKGTQIGNNVVIGAGCTINQNIPDNTVVTASQHLNIRENTKTYN